MTRAIGILAATLFLAGCATTAGPLDTSYREVGQGLAAAEAQREIAVEHADKPEVVTSVLGDAGQRKSLKEASEALSAAESTARTRQGELETLQAQYDELRNWWVVKVAIGIWHAIWWFTAAYMVVIAMRIVALFFPAGSAVGYTLSLISGGLLPVLNYIPELIWKRIAAKQRSQP